MLKQSFNKLCFCEKKGVHFSSYFCWQLTCIDLLSLEDSFLLRSHSCEILCSTQYLCLLMEEHSVWLLCYYYSKNLFCLRTSKAFLNAQCVVALALTPLLCQADDDNGIVDRCRDYYTASCWRSYLLLVQEHWVVLLKALAVLSTTLCYCPL